MLALESANLELKLADTNANSSPDPSTISVMVRALRPILHSSNTCLPQHHLVSELETKINLVDRFCTTEINIDKSFEDQNIIKS